MGGKGNNKWARIGNAPSPDGIVEENSDEWMSATVGDYAGATTFAFVSAALCFYWAGFVLVNTIYVHEYTSLNMFNSGRYNWVDWWGVWMLTWNVSLPMMFALAITYSNVRVWSRIHATLSYLTILASILSLIFLSIGWVFFCNNTSSGVHTACNDYRWCGVYFDAVGGFSTNGIPFPALESSQLGRNAEMTTHWIFCWVYLVVSVLHTIMNREFRQYGILKF